MAIFADWDTDTSVPTAVFEALGAVSMCWSETPTGVFDSGRATAIGNELLTFLQSKG